MTSHKLVKPARSLWYGPATVSRRRTRSAAFLAGVSGALALAVASAAAAGGGPGARERILRAQTGDLATKVRSASLDLYALDAKLGAARTRLVALQASETRLRDEQRMLTSQIAATRHTLAVSQRNLGANLRVLYEAGDPDPIAVILGAESLSDAVTTLDSLKLVADQSKQFVLTSTNAEQRLTRLRAQLSHRRAHIAAAVDAAARTTRALADARSARVSFITSLRARQALAARQIQALEASVQRAEVKSQALTAAAAASGPATSLTGNGTSPAPVSAPAQSGGRTLTVSATGYSLPGRTASGLPVGWGVVAVDPTVIPLGTRMTIPGYGEGVAADVGSGIRGAMIDLWFPTVGQALEWGRRTVTITLH